MELLECVVADTAPRALIWSSETRSLTLPERFSRSTSFAEAAADLEAKGWPVITRRTGGGITPQGPGIVNVALAFTVPPKDARSVPASYSAICDPLISAFAEFGLTARAGSVAHSFCDGDYNLEIDGQKIVGTAQRWRGAAVLCHALVLIDLDLEDAVAAAQSLSDGIELGDCYRIEAHTSLAAQVNVDKELSTGFAQCVREKLMKLGYREHN